MLAVSWLLAFSTYADGRSCDGGRCNDCGQAAADCLETLNQEQSACVNQCLAAVTATGSLSGYFDCIGACIDLVNDGIAACDATADSCRQSYCEGLGCTVPSEQPPVITDPAPDPAPEPEPAPEVPIDQPTPPRPPATCKYQYLPQVCQVPDTERCLFNGKKLVRGTPPTFNGCGPLADSLGLEAIRVALDTFAGDFQDSCNNHDICYGSCSFGDDSLFNTCNSNFLAQMLAACKMNYPTIGGSIGGSIFRSARGAICVAQANFVYSTVQLGGCGAYGKAQYLGCRCVDCDDTPMEINTITVLNPVVNAATAFCGIAPDIAADWTNFLVDLAAAIASAPSTAIASALRLFGAQIGYTSAQPSPQIQALVQSCRGSSRRRSHIRLSIRQTRSRLSDYFTSLSLDANTTYGCSADINSSACDTANALVAIARIARALDEYGISGATPITPSGISSNGSIPSSTTTVSISLSKSPDPSATGTAISGSVALSPSAETSTLSTPLDTIRNVSLSSTVMATGPLGSSSISMTATSTTLGITASSSANCKLVKVYGDTPDSESLEPRVAMSFIFISGPDSPDGQPEIPENPDYPVCTPVSYMMGSLVIDE